MNTLQLIKARAVKNRAVDRARSAMVRAFQNPDYTDTQHTPGRDVRVTVTGWRRARERDGHDADGRGRLDYGWGTSGTQGYWRVLRMVPCLSQDVLSGTTKNEVEP